MSMRSSLISASLTLRDGSAPHWVGLSMGLIFFGSSGAFVIGVWGFLFRQKPPITMNFSDQWRSLFPIPSVFAPPSLLSSSAAVGPLHLRPSQSHPHALSLLPSLQFPPPLHPSSHLAAIRAFFNSSSFLPHSSLSSIASDILSSLNPPDDPAAAAVNALCSLRLSAAPSSVLLLFPTGENSHSIGFLRLSFPSIEASKICVQKDGLKHPYHRILKMSVAPAAEEGEHLAGEKNTIVVVEGFLIAATLYSVNWFRVETRVSGVWRQEEAVSVVPMAKQEFESVVVDARLCPHWPERSVVLLESGELCWFDLESKRSGKIGVCEGLGGWLGCEFGGQPWIVLVACSSAVLVVDLRAEKGMEPKVLVRMDAGQNDRIVAFSRSSADLHMSVVTEQRLLLFDIRQPLVPVLMWDHGLHRPCYVSMFRLSELRPSEEFKWASDSGSVILVGSFWKDEFNIFFCGPREGSACSGDPMLYAWELPLSFSLSGQRCGSVDSLVKDDLWNNLEWGQRKDVVVGFWIVPSNLLKVESEHGGFALIRLMLSGKLEMHRYHASWDSVSKKSNGEGEESPKVKDSVACSKDSFACSTGHKGKKSSRYSSLNIGHLLEYMNGILSSVTVIHNPQLNRLNKKIPKDHLERLKGIKMKSSNSPISTFISDATVPCSIFEITLRKILNNLELDFLPLAFSQYSLLFGNHNEATLALLEVPKCLLHHRSIPFFVGNPLKISERWSRKVPPGEALVGPVIPVPVLLLLQLIDHQKSTSCLEEEPQDDLLTLECRTTLENVYPEISLADTGNFSECVSGLQDEKSFFVYEKSVFGNLSTCNGSGRMEGCAVKKELSQADQTCLEPNSASEDEKFTTFICGIANKTCYSNSAKEEAVGFEMFDRLNPYKLDFDSPSIDFQPKEQDIYKRLTRQSFKWLGNYKPHESWSGRGLVD